MGSTNTNINRVVRRAKSVSGLLAILLALFAAPGYAQLPHTEDFTTTTNRDGAAGQTTADWAGTGSVLLPTSATLLDPFTATTTRQSPQPRQQADSTPL